MIGKFWFTKNIKLIIGSGGTTQPGFISTDIDVLDIRKPWHWWRNFWPSSISVVVAEHVFEHLTTTEVEKSFRLINLFLKKDGVLRLAIPDKNRKDKKYVMAVKPPNDGHKSFFNITEISSLLTDSGFKIVPLEYFDDSGKFNHKKWSDKDGKISRSFKHDKQIEFKIGKHYYTSLIVDAIKK